MIDPILMQNREIIEKAYEHINIMTNSNFSSYANTNKIMFGSLFIIFLSYIYMNKNKIECLLKDFDNDNTFKMKKKNENEFIHEEQVVLNDADEEELSDFEY